MESVQEMGGKGLAADIRNDRGEAPLLMLSTLLRKRASYSSRPLSTMAYTDPPEVSSIIAAWMAARQMLDFSSYASASINLSFAGAGPNTAASF